MQKFMIPFPVHSCIVIADEFLRLASVCEAFHPRSITLVERRRVGDHTPIVVRMWTRRIHVAVTARMHHISDPSPRVEVEALSIKVKERITTLGPDPYWRVIVTPLPAWEDAYMRPSVVAGALRKRKLVPVSTPLELTTTAKVV